MIPHRVEQLSILSVASILGISQVLAQTGCRRNRGASVAGCLSSLHRHGARSSGSSNGVPRDASPDQLVHRPRSVPARCSSASINGTRGAVQVVGVLPRDFVAIAGKNSLHGSVRWRSSTCSWVVILLWLVFDYLAAGSISLHNRRQPAARGRTEWKYRRPSM